MLKYQEAPGLKGNIDKEYFKREGTCLKEGAIIVLEMEGIQKLLESCSAPWWRQGCKLME